MRIRFRVRTLLISIAVLAVTLGAVQAKRRQDFYRRCVEYHQAREQLSRMLANNPKAAVGICGTGYEGVPRSASDPCYSGFAMGHSHYLTDAAYHARLKQEYERRLW
jgi:hypothetical protein